MFTTLSSAQIETINDLGMLDVEELFRMAEECSHSAKKLSSDSPRTDRDYGLKREYLQLSGFCSNGAEIKTADDNISLLSIQRGDSRLHLTRKTSCSYPKIEGYFELAAAKLQSLHDRVKCGKLPGYSDIGLAYDPLDRIGRSCDTRSIEKHVRNATAYLRSDEFRAAALEFKFASAKLRDLAKTLRSQMTPRASDRHLLRNTLLQLHSEVLAPPITVKSLHRLFDAIDQWPETTSRIVPFLKLVQALARQEVEPIEALEMIAAKLLKTVPWNDRSKSQC